MLITGEITTKANVNFVNIARQKIAEIGYTNADNGFSANSTSVLLALDEQSPDIAQGVNTAQETRQQDSDELFDKIGAGDQGIMFGFASNETPELMPLPISLAHRIARRLAAVRKTGELSYLRPDGKTQVTVVYEDGRPVGIDTILISTQHTATIGEITDEAAPSIQPLLGKSRMRRLYKPRLNKTSGQQWSNLFLATLKLSLIRKHVF